MPVYNNNLLFIEFPHTYGLYPSTFPNESYKVPHEF